MTCPHCGEDAYDHLRCRACGVDDLQQEMARWPHPLDASDIRKITKAEADAGLGAYALAARDPFPMRSVQRSRGPRRSRRGSLAFMLFAGLLYVLALITRWRLGQ